VSNVAIVTIIAALTTCMLQAELHKRAAASAAGLLQLAMNSSSNAAAEAAAHHIPGQLDPEVACKLLTTAALRQHVSAVQHMAGLAVMQQHADAAVLQALLQELIAPASLPYADSVWDSHHLPKGLPAAQQQHSSLQRSLCIHAICAMPAAGRLGSDAVAQLLLAAVRSRAQIICIGRLRRLPAVRQFSSDQIVELLEAAIEQNWASCTEQLCKLPAAHQLSADMLVQLLQTAIEKDSRECAQTLCCLPAAQDVSSSMLVQLLRAAVKCSSGCFCYLYELPAADDISKKHAMQLFSLSFQAKNSSATDCLIDLPAMALCEPQDVLQLMLAAAEHRFGDGLSMLCGLSIADHLSSSDLAEVLVLIAMQQGFAPDCLRNAGDLQALPAASQLTSEQMAQILAAAVQLDNFACLQALCGWQAAMILDNLQIMPLLAAALQLGHDDCASFLCSKLTMWTDVGTAHVMQLLMAAVQHGCSGCFKELCGLRASVSKLDAEHLSPLLEAAVKHKDSACLLEVLVVAQANARDQRLDPVVFVPAIKAAVSLNDASTVRHLCMLTIAWHLDAFHVAELLQAAKQAGSIDCIEQLCQLPAAQQLQMSCTDAVELMLAAAENGSKDCMLHLCRMPAGKFLTWSQVEGLLQVSVGVGSVGCIELLCQLPAAAGLSMAVVAQLLHAAKQQGGAGCERT
jgi:hypothetical protein